MMAFTTRADVEMQISRHLPAGEFVRILTRLQELRREEEEKLKALAQLQQYYVAATTDQERDSVKDMVGKIREISRAARQEIRALQTELTRYWTMEEARDLFERWQNSV